MAHTEETAELQEADYAKDEDKTLPRGRYSQESIIS